MEVGQVHLFVRKHKLHNFPLLSPRRAEYLQREEFSPSVEFYYTTGAKNIQTVFVNFSQKFPSSNEHHPSPAVPSDHHGRDPAEQVDGVAAHDHDVRVLPRRQGAHPVSRSRRSARGLMVMAARAASGFMPPFTAMAAHRGRYWTGISGWSVQMADLHPVQREDRRGLQGHVGQLRLGPVPQAGAGDDPGPLLGQQRRGSGGLRCRGR